MSKQLALIDNLMRKGFFHIFTSQLLNKIIAFSSGIILVRFLSKSDFGLYTYTYNLISIFLLFNGLGATSGLLQFGSENLNNPEKIRAYTKLSYKIGIVFNIMVSLLILSYGIFFDLKIKGASNVFLLMTFIPLISFIYMNIEMGFRVRVQNKVYSSITTLNSTLLLIGTIIGAYFFQIEGVILFRYISYIICILIAIYIAYKLGNYNSKVATISNNEKKSFIKLSLVSSINNGVSQMLYLLDILIIGIITPNEQIIATYKTATIIPFAMIFIPLSIITFIYPYFAKNNKNLYWIRTNYYKLLKIMIIVNALISLVMFIFAPIIIKLLFGEDYLESVPIFRILSIGYFIAATFRIPSGNILLSLRKIKFNFYNTIISGILNIALNIFLIKKFGSIGAAYTTLTVYVISSLISTIYLNKTINNKPKHCLK